jgi:hypothetical protein
VNKADQSVTWVADGRKFRGRPGSRIQELPYSPQDSEFYNEPQHATDLGAAEMPAATRRIVAIVTAKDEMGLNLRSTPKQNGSTIVGTLHHGDHVFLELGYVTNSDPPAAATWQKVTSMSGYTGWIRADYLSNLGLAGDANRGGGD